MADIAVDAGCHQLGGFFKGQQLFFAYPLPRWLAMRRQCADAEDQRDEAGQQQDPRDKLVRRSGRQKPGVQLEQDQRQNELPGEEAEKAVRARPQQRAPRDINEA